MRPATRARLLLLGIVLLCLLGLATLLGCNAGTPPKHRFHLFGGGAGSSATGAAFLLWPLPLGGFVAIVGGLIARYLDRSRGAGTIVIGVLLVLTGFVVLWLAEQPQVQWLAFIVLLSVGIVAFYATIRRASNGHGFIQAFAERLVFGKVRGAASTEGAASA